MKGEAATATLSQETGRKRIVPQKQKREQLKADNARRVKEFAEAESGRLKAEQQVKELDKKLKQAAEYGNARGVKSQRSKAEKIAKAIKMAKNGELEKAGIGYLKKTIGCSDAIAAEIQSELEKAGLGEYKGKNFFLNKAA